MNIILAGTTEVPKPQIKALLDDFINAHKYISFKTQGELSPNLTEYLTDLSTYGMAPAEQVVILAWDNSPICHALLKEARKNKITVLDLTNWLDEMFLEDEDIYHCT